MEAVKESRLNFRKLTSWPALLFFRAYSSLATILHHRIPTFIQDPYITPPTQTVVPVDPKFSDSSGSSKPEGYTDRFADAYVEASFITIKDALGGMSWLDPSHKFLFTSTSYFSRPNLMCLVLNRRCL